MDGAAQAAVPGLSDSIFILESRERLLILFLLPGFSFENTLPA
jgi:hypothetical protein